jgi:hypothetical protein
LRWLWYEWVDPNRPWVGAPPSCDLTDKALFHASTVVTIGRDDKASFWHSSWLNGCAPIDIASNLYPLAWRKNQKVKDDLLHMNWTRGLWRMEYVQQMAEFVELWDLVSVIQLVDREDTISQRWTPDGCYSAKSAY